jgi:hypothetical protein
VSSKPGFKLLAELNAPGSGAWQGAARNSRTGEWFLAHSDGDGDTHLYRFHAGDAIVKRYRDKMTCLGAAHVYGFGVSDSNIVWLGWDGRDGNDVVTLSYRPGETVRKPAATKMHVFTERPAQVSFSPTRAGLVVMETAGASYRFTKRLKVDVLANQDRPQGRTITLPKPTTTWLQGFSLAGEFLYVAWGKTAQRSWIDKWSFTTGERVGRLDVSAAGFLPGERATPASASRELEGMDARTFAVKVYRDGARRLRVYQLENF